MPSNVARFEQLFYASLIVGVFIFASDFERLEKLGPVSSMIATIALTVALLVLLVWLIARRGKNWARWVLVVGFVGGLPFYVMNMSEQRALTALLSALQLVLQVVALVFLFTGNARAWFARAA